MCRFDIEERSPELLPLPSHDCSNFVLHSSIFAKRKAAATFIITTVGPYCIRTPLTNRINRLETERDVLRFEECAEVMVGRARFLHQGLNGHSFRRVQAHESAGLTMWEYRLPLFIFSSGSQTKGHKQHSASNPPRAHYLGACVARM